MTIEGDAARWLQVLVTDWNPLTVWIWKQPYIRFAAVKYDESLEDDDKFMHLVLFLRSSTFFK